LKDYGDKLPADKKAPIETALNDLKEAHKNRDIASIDKSMEALNAAWTAASEEMYKATQGGPTGTPGDGTTGSNPGNPNDNVTDVDFEDVKEDKK
jgi:molecular chaperone DnaK